MAPNMTNVFKKIRFSVAIFPNRAERRWQLPLAYECSYNLLHYDQIIISSPVHSIETYQRGSEREKSFFKGSKVPFLQSYILTLEFSVQA